MKLFIVLFAGLISFAHAETFELKSARMDYQVKHLMKRVSGESKDIKGKMECGEKECEFLLGTHVKSFISSDSNRDLNMQNTAETGKFPVTSASGKISASQIKTKGSFKHPIEVEFHGKKKIYEASTEILGENKMRSEFVLMLDAHGIERPSLFGVRINDGVPMTLEMNWIRK